MNSAQRELRSKHANTLHSACRGVFTLGGEASISSLLMVQGGRKQKQTRGTLLSRHRERVALCTAASGRTPTHCEPVVFGLCAPRAPRCLPHACHKTQGNSHRGATGPHSGTTLPQPGLNPTRATTSIVFKLWYLLYETPKCCPMWRLFIPRVASLGQE